MADQKRTENQDFGDSSSVSDWIDLTKAGDAEAAKQLWDRYFQQLVAFADRRLPNGMTRSKDGEDCAIEAFHALLEGFRSGRFERVLNRADFWVILTVIASRRVKNQIRHELRQKRRVSDLSGDGISGGFAELADGSLDPSWVVELAEITDLLMRALPDDVTRAIANLRLAGHTVKEMKMKLDVPTRTIERKLKLIRDLWLKHIEVPQRGTENDNHNNSRNSR